MRMDHDHHDQALSRQLTQCIHRLFELGLQIQTISMNNDFSSATEQKLANLSQAYEQQHHIAIEAGAPLQQIIHIKHINDEYFFTIYEDKTAYQKIHNDEDQFSFKTHESTAVA